VITNPSHSSHCRPIEFSVNGTEQVVDCIGGKRHSSHCPIKTHPKLFKNKIVSKESRGSFQWVNGTDGRFSLWNHEVKYVPLNFVSMGREWDSWTDGGAA
jgi:hypothetical protein